ncbi:MAG TPA: HEAT repeat domain-containing protein [Planctomycetota bacterium]|nr:HEAT repeat domain-containing protein [Planctomycetota bacterium]
MDSTLRSVLRLLEEGSPEVRCAAAVVLGALGEKEEPVVEALRARLKDDNPLVRRFAAEGLGRIGARRTFPDLIELVAHGGDTGRAAAAAVAAMGAAGVHALKELMSKVAPGVRPIIAGAIGHGGGKEAEKAALESLLDSDPAVVEATRRSIESEVSAANGEQKKELASHFLRFLQRKEVAAHPTATAALLRLFEPLAEPRLAGRLWSFAGPDRPPTVRAAALRVLATLPPPKEKEEIGRLFDALGSEGVTLTEPALRILEKAEVPKGLEGRLLGLLDSPEPGARIFALRKLRSADTPEVGRAVVEHLDHPDPEVRREAEETASALRCGREALLERLDRAREAEEAGRVAAVLLRGTAPFDEAAARTIVARALRWIEAGDPRWEWALQLLRRSKGGEAFGVLRDRGRALRRAKKWKEALAFYRLVARDSRFGAEDRFDLAVVGLHTGNLNPSPDLRGRDPALGHLEDLLRAEGFDLLGSLKKERTLTPRECYYVGFHFSEKAGPAAAFGGEVLKLVASRAPRSAEGKAAKNKLVREALV